MNWENLLTGFSFKFRILVNLVASGYAFAAILPYFGVGKSGFMNFSNAVNCIHLNSLAEYIESIYRLLGSGAPSIALQGVLLIWVILAFLSLVAQYEDGLISNLIPSSAIASAFILALWVDLVSPKLIAPLASVIVALIVIVAKSGGFRSTEGWITASLAFLGILLSFFYVFIAFPLWMAGQINLGYSEGEG